MTSKEKEYLLSIANKFGTIDCEYLTSIDGEKMRKIVESVPVNYDESNIAYWILDHDALIATCSNCGNRIMACHRDKYNFCGTCGFKMEGDIYK